jgi:hypothetical protein
MIGIIPDPIRRPLSTQTVHSGVRVPEADIPLRTIVGDDEADSGLASDFITSSDKPGRNAERIKCTSRSINQVIEDPYVVSAISIPNVDAQLFEVFVRAIFCRDLPPNYEGIPTRASPNFLLPDSAKGQ